MPFEIGADDPAGGQLRAGAKTFLLAG